MRPLGVRKQGLSLLLASALRPPHFIPGKVGCEPTLGIEDAVGGTVSPLRYAQSQASTSECGLCRCNPVAKWSFRVQVVPEASDLGKEEMET